MTPDKDEVINLLALRVGTLTGELAFTQSALNAARRRVAELEEAADLRDEQG